jgi:hypothetical protein
MISACGQVYWISLGSELSSWRSSGIFHRASLFFSLIPSFEVMELVVGMIIGRSGLYGDSLLFCQVALGAKVAREIPRFARNDGTF